MSDGIRFIDGGKVQIITSEQLDSCDYTIFIPSHYRDDGTCRCDDPNDPDMAGWGYVWSDKRKKWLASWDEEGLDNTE